MLSNVEGSWLGLDKVAHFMFSPAVTAWFLVWVLATGKPWGWAVGAWGISVLAGFIWEASNHWLVITGRRGISARDMVAFVAGDILAFILMIWTIRSVTWP